MAIGISFIPLASYTILCIIMLIVVGGGHVSSTLAEETKPFPVMRMFNLKASHHSTSTTSDDSISMVLGKIKQLPFIPTTMHPFTSNSQLTKAIASDPYDLAEYPHYKKVSEQQVRSMYSNIVNSKASKRSIKKNLDMLVTESVDYVNLNDVSRFSAMGSLHRYSVDANVLSGVASLDYEQNVWDVTCSVLSDEQTEIVVDFANGHTTAMKWVPGTRIIIGKQWNCYGDLTDQLYNKDQARFYLILTRSIIVTDENMLRIKFLTQPLTFSQLFMNGRVEYSSTPLLTESLDETNVFTQGASSRSLRSRKAQFSYTKRMAAFNFNYNDATGQPVNDEVTMYDQDGLKIICEKCYAYLNTEFRVEFEFSWTQLQVTKAEASVGGQWKATANVKASITKSFQKKIGPNTIIQTPPIGLTFFIWVIPVYVDFTPKLQYSFNFQLTGTLEYSRKFDMAYEKYIGFSYTPEAGYNKVTRGDDAISFTSSSPGLRIELDGSIEVALIPALDITFYKLATVSIGIVPSLKADLHAEGIISSLDNYKAFVSVKCSYKIGLTFDVLIKNFEFTLLDYQPIEKLSGTYSIQSASYKAINPNDQIYSKDNLLPTIPDTATTSNTMFSFEISGLTGNYYMEYQYQDIKLSPLLYRTAPTQSCVSGSVCKIAELKPDFSYSYLYFRFLKDVPLWFDDTVLVDYIEQKNYVTTQSSQTIFGNTNAKVIVKPTDLTISFSNTPTNSFKLPTGISTINVKLSPINSLYYISFTTDSAISITNVAMQFSSDSNGFHYAFNGTLPGGTILISNSVSDNNLKFHQYFSFDLTKEKQTLTPAPTPITSMNAISSFLQVVKKNSPRYAVSAKIKGNFVVMIFEGWDNGVSFVQTKGRKFSQTSIPIKNGNVTLTEPLSYYWTISMENDFGSSSHYIAAQFLPVDSYGFILESVKIDPYTELSVSSSNTLEDVDNAIINQVSSVNLYPYMAVSRPDSNSFTARLGNSVFDVFNNLKSQISLSIQKSARIPIDNSYLNADGSLALSLSSSANVTIFNNYKLLNGMASVGKKFESALSFAVSCDTLLSVIGDLSRSGDIFIRILDGLTNRALENRGFSISLELAKPNSDIVSIHMVNSKSGLNEALFNVDSPSKILSSCNSNPTYYVRVILTRLDVSLSSKTVQVEFSFSKKVLSTLPQTRSILSESIDPKTKGISILDLSDLIQKEKSLGSIGIVLQANTQNCNIDMYINSNNASAPPSFFDPATIFDSTSRNSLTYEALPISFLSSYGSSVMLYSESACTFDLSYSQLKLTYLTMKFIDLKGSAVDSVIFYSNTSTTIQLLINDENHSFEKTWVTSLQSNPSLIFSIFKSTKKSDGTAAKLSDYFKSAVCNLVNAQTLQFEMIPKSGVVFTNILSIEFNAQNSMFTSRYNLRSSNVVSLGENVQPIVYKSTSSGQPKGGQSGRMNGGNGLNLLLVC
ncbi:hypothetical protein NAEGRDRAFT_79262 [Naegleria gruberi]|uniref:Uncharacterized protein n=1 Tax=Naegleria gruberi TaxID=5762 RepID=D2VB08_NAEGR|nr:uncharacterized protein NAEGRDRAFT_79262 [Naegleria gruberi]EFC46039.1 hypothetical protein NAEGRDRAFT_79262 [Naegleria gruberi]|eukprot:XP_002678783.1 hypothetical protein NAEGRDRAFT_79262 [Naegleria gruberi strain NEG-M]